MPYLSLGPTRLYYSLSGPDDAPLLLMSNSIGTTAELWDAQLPELAERFRVVRYDTRGHGRSDVAQGPYTLDLLGRDALAVLDAVDPTGTQRAHVCGISLGGMTAMWLGLAAPDRVARLVLANTAAKIGTPELWEGRMRFVRTNGMDAVADGSMERWFTPAFRAREPETVARFQRMVASCSAEAYCGCSAAIRDVDLREDVRRIAAPTLVIVGEHDPSTTPADGALLRERIPDARLVSLDCAHLSNVERAEEFTAAVFAFLTSTTNAS